MADSARTTSVAPSINPLRHDFCHYDNYRILLAHRFIREDSKMSIASWFSKMTGAAITLDTLDKVLLMELRDLYSAERQLIDALPKMANAASSSDLKSAFRSHLKETKIHAIRLEKIFKLLNEDKGSEHCEAMQGLIAEGSAIIEMDGEPSVKDAALIAAAQRVEHYEIAGYGCARAFARRLGRKEIEKHLQATIEEEGNADKTLTRISDGYEAPVEESESESLRLKSGKGDKRAKTKRTRPVSKPAPARTITTKRSKPTKKRARTKA